MAGDVVRVGGTSSKDHGTKGRHENTAKVTKRRANERAEKDIAPVIRDHQRDHFIPVRDLDAEIARGEINPEELRPIGTLIAGVQDFKVLRGSIAVLSLATSIEFSHLLTDAAMMSRGSVLVAKLYEVRRDDLFPEPEEDESA